MKLFYTGSPLMNQNKGPLLPANKMPIASGATSYTNAQGQRMRGVYLDDNGDTDYSKLINEGIANGTSADQIKQWNDSRNDKIKENASLGKYQNDATSAAAQDYIRAANAKREQERIDNFYAQQRAAAEAAQRAKVDMAVGRLGAQKNQVGQSYTDLFRQLYLDKKMAEKNLPQQMAAMGYTGGLTESSALGLATNYAEALRKGEEGRIGNLSELDRAIADTQFSGDISIAENASKLATEQFNAYSELLRQQKEQENLDRQYGDNRTQQELENKYRSDQWDWQKSEADYKKKESGALLLAGIGDYSGVAELWGLNDAQTKGLVADYAKTRGLSDTQAAQDLAAFYAKYGDFSKLSALGIDTSYLDAERLGAVNQQMQSVGKATPEKLPPNNLRNPYREPPRTEVQEAETPSMAAGKIAMKLPFIGSDQRKLTLIEQAYQAGEITRRDVEALLNMLGL